MAGQPSGPGDITLPDHYVIEAEIGRGGMGTVYRAHDLKHDRPVAIKVLRHEIARTFGRERFQREIRTAARLMHPNIVTVFDSGEADGTLYYVMPYVEGVSLRERLEREKQLSVGEAVHIARQVANALQYAHEQGVIHRDIKPENIVLADGHAWLVDFGVARAAAAGVSTQQTTVGLILGSPLYLSPEQARGQKDVDGRADIYSLACVLYEMLAGAPPFVADTPQAVLMRHLTEQPQQLTRTRPNVPPALDTVVRKALMKTPSDRYRSAGEFESALTVAETGANTRFLPAAIGGRRWLRRTVTVGAWVLGAAVPIGIGIAADALSASFDLPDIGSMLARRSDLDTTRFVVLPFAAPAELAALDAEVRMADALSTWRGIEVVDPSEVKAGQVVSSRQAERHAREFESGRYITGTLSKRGDSLRIYAELGDANRPNVKLSKVRLTVATDAKSLATAFPALVDSLLLSGLASECIRGSPATREIAALRLCDKAFSAIEDGELAIADSAFTEAVRVDPQYARADLWLSQLRSWLRVGDVEISSHIRPADLPTIRERQLIHGYASLAGRQFDSACEAFNRLISMDSLDYAAWLGLGECVRRDDRVVVQGGSPRFVSSYHRALRAYERSFQIKPSLLGAFRQNSFQAVREALKTSATATRAGRAVGDTTTYLAYAAFESDTLAFVPRPAFAFSLLTTEVLPRSFGQATAHQRALFRRIASNWAQRLPSSASAAYATAVAAELEGDASAIGEIRKARTRRMTPMDSFRLANSEIWLQLKFGLPDDHAAIRRAKFLADSLLQHVSEPTAEQAQHLAALALLIGRPSVAARHARKAAVLRASEANLPVGLMEPARALLAFAAAGGPTDSLKRLEAEVERAIQNSVTAPQQSTVFGRVFSQAAMVAFPDYRLRNLARIGSTGAFTDAQAGLVLGDTAKARNALSRLAQSTRRALAADLSIDGVFAEAALHVAVGQRKEAERVLDRALEALRWGGPGRLQDLARAGTLRRAMQLRARLAFEQGDTVMARKWSIPVALLSGAVSSR